MAANEEQVRSISRIANADFTGSNTGIYRFVKVGSNQKVALCDSGDAALGVLRGKADEDQAIEVAIGGRVLVELGASVTAGSRVQSGSGGSCITLASGADLGTALEGGVTGDIISVVLDAG